MTSVRTYPGNSIGVNLWQLCASLKPKSTVISAFGIGGIVHHYTGINAWAREPLDTLIYGYAMSERL